MSEAPRATGSVPHGHSARRVRNRDDLQEFIALAGRIARTNGTSDHYVPLLSADIKDWFAGRGWFTEPVELWLLDDAQGHTVARTICHRSPELGAKLGGSEGEFLFFGALEAEHDDALRALIGFLETRSRDLGCTRIFGPVSPLPNVTGGLLTSGEAEPGFFDSVWNPNSFAEVFDDCGYTPWGPAHTWEISIDEVPAARATAPSPAEWESNGYRRRPVTRLGVGGFARRLLPTLNAAFAQLPYYTEIAPEQLKAQMDGLWALMDPELIIEVAGLHDPVQAPPRCFALVIPDPLPILRRHDGTLGPRTVTDMLLNRNELKDAVLIIQGTDPASQGQGILSLVVRQLFSVLSARGYRKLRVTFIAEDNPASAAVFEKSGGRKLHGISFVERHLERPERASIQELFTQAALAPSAHNTQPWCPRIEAAPSDGPATISVTVDRDRCLPVGDPEFQDLHLSMGAWLESLSIATEESGRTITSVEVSGHGPEIAMRIVIEDGNDRANSHDGWPSFTVADLRHRQVDRGTLVPDPANFLPVLESINLALRLAGARLIVIPDDVWKRLLGLSATFSFSNREILAETLSWLRLSTTDPRYYSDGLNAECLRLPSLPGPVAAAVQSRFMHRILGTGVPALLTPITALRRRFVHDPAPTRAQRDTPSAHHVVLVDDTQTAAGQAHPSLARAQRDIELGRELMRTWLLLDRSGLRVDVHSEIKDCPDSKRILLEHIAESGPYEYNSLPQVGWPVAVFSVGKSTSPVPRSQRLNA